MAIDPHGFAFGVCVQIARASAAVRAGGRTVRQIRVAIDARYVVLGGATRTPMPPDDDGVCTIASAPSVDRFATGDRGRR